MGGRENIKKLKDVGGRENFFYKNNFTFNQIYLRVVNQRSKKFIGVLLAWYLWYYIDECFALIAQW